jgi:glycosyltransferase involved in cell wall biosynthesis
LNIPEGSLLAVYGGNIGVAASVEAVIPTFEQLPPEDDVRLLIAGAGSQLEACRRLAAETPGGRVLIHSPWPAAETAATFAAADVLLLPMQGAQSLFSVPAKMIAYLFAARPIVALALPGSDVAQIVEGAGCGWVVEPNQPAALAGLLHCLSSMDRAELRRQGEAGRAFALQHHTSLKRPACPAWCALSKARPGPAPKPSRRR